MINRLVLIFLLAGYWINLQAQMLHPVNIQIIAEDPESNESNDYQKHVEQELQSLLGTRYELGIETKSCDCSRKTSKTISLRHLRIVLSISL